MSSAQLATVPEQRTADRAAPPEAASSPGGRDPVLDSAKLLAMVLVVVGHAVEPLLATQPVRAFYIVIYAFHMPLFAMISGYVSKDLSMSDRRVRRLITGVLVPYVIFETAYSLFVAALNHRRPEISLLDSYWLMWFLAALFVWRAAMPLLVRLRWPLAIALAASLLIGFTDKAGPNVVYRTIGLFPFFVLGYLLPAGFHARLRTTSVRLAAVAAFAAAGAAAWMFGPQLNLHFLWWKSYGVAGADGLAPVAVRTLLLVGGVVLSLGFLAWTPGSAALARWGERSLYAYLLHGFVILAAKELGWFAHVRSPAGVAAVVGLGVALTLVLASGPVRRVFRPLVESRMRWALRDVAPAGRTDRPPPRPPS